VLEEDRNSEKTEKLLAQSGDRVNVSEQGQEKASWTSLFSNPAYIVYCVSQVIFLAGFIVNQLYIVPFAEVEVSIKHTCTSTRAMPFFTDQNTGCCSVS